MTLNGWLQILFFLLAVFLVTPPLGSFMCTSGIGAAVGVGVAVSAPAPRMVHVASAVPMFAFWTLEMRTVKV